MEVALNNYTFISRRKKIRYGHIISIEEVCGVGEAGILFLLLGVEEVGIPGPGL